MSEAEPEREDQSTESWLNEISLATKLVLMLTLVAIGGFFLVVIVEQILLVRR